MLVAADQSLENQNQPEGSTKSLKRFPSFETLNPLRYSHQPRCQGIDQRTMETIGKVQATTVRKEQIH